MNAQEGKTKAMRQWRFNSINELDKKLIQAYVLEAMKNSDDGKEMKHQRNKKPLEIPSLLISTFTNNKELKEKFDVLSLTKKESLQSV